MPFNPDAFTEDSRRNWDAAAPRYRDLSERLFSQITEKFLDLAAIKAGELVLDVACGPGTATLGARRRVGDAGRVTGIDLSREMLAQARKRVPETPFQEMNAEKLDFPDASFDAVICQLGLMLFARPEQALREMARVAKRGGRVACLVQGAAEKMVFTSLLMRVLVAHAPQIKEEGAPTLYAFAAPGVLEQALGNAGLNVERAERLEGFFDFDSPEDYWRTMTEGAGRTGAILRSLPETAKSAVEKDVLDQAGRYRQGDKLKIPFEVVMAAGRKG